MSDIHNGESVYASLASLSFKLRAVERIGDRTGRWSLGNQFLESHLLICVVSGEGTLSLDGQLIELCAGCAYAGSPGQLAEAMIRGMDEQGSYVLRFDVYVQEERDTERIRMIRPDARLPLQELTASSPLALALACEAIVRPWQENRPLQRFGAEVRFQELLYMLLDDASGAVQGDTTALANARDYIERHFRQKMTITELAQAARMSERHFMRQFKKRYGCSAMDYLASYRIRQAQILMNAVSPYPLKDIASHVGYPDEVYFRRKFKQISGITPAAFMRSSRQRIAAYHPQIIGILLALQIIPCAAPASHPWTGYYRRKYETERVLPLSDDTGERVDQLAAGSCDIILAIDSLLHPQERLALVEAAAAVYEVPWSGQDWRGHLREVARFLGIPGMAEAWLTRYSRKVESLRAQIASAIRDERLLVMRVQAQGLSVPGSGTIADVFYEDLGFAKPGSQVSDWPGEFLSLPMLDTLQADRLLVIVDEDRQAMEQWQALQNSGQWQALDAVRNGRIDRLSASPLSEYTAFTHDLILDEVRKRWHDRA
ncbi:AraC family transcriptional regulator [Paenibacillus sp. 1P07SE]|uniref:AraC family transcriptional regulator n=1 Tax=Paenibacillus sp. 1P07SE TaxID=3132209 RepID=UPI0039A605FE